uniref:Uncharacterized protein n=2 Tax=Arion vulgaris TaxID=1028688 RepID=A0A0B7BHR1_9EUPU
MYEIPATSTQNRIPGIYRQSTRQSVVLRSQKLPMGRWHMKSLVVTTGLLLLMFYYVYKMDLQPGSKTRKRDLVVRPGKPYKSPYSRRRHTKQYKDATSNLPLSVSSSGSALHFVKKSETKVNKPKLSSPQLLRSSETVGTTAKVHHHTEKYSGVSKGKTQENVRPLSPTLSEQKPVLDILKTKRKTDNSNSRVRIPGVSVKGLQETHIVDQNVVKSLVSTGGLMHQLSQKPQDSPLKVYSAAVHNATGMLTGNRKIVAPLEVGSKIISKNVMKMKPDIIEGLPRPQSLNQIPKLSN